MPLTCDWNSVPRRITLPLSELTFIGGTEYQITVDHWWQLLRELNGSIEGIAETIGLPLYTNIPPTTSTPRIVEVTFPEYEVIVEDGLFSLDIIDGNTNWREIEVKNTVSIGTNNTAALIDPTFLEAGLFFEGVILDTVNGVAGTGKTTTGGIIGTRQTPSNNLADTHIIAEFRGTRKIIVKQSMTFDTEDLSDGHSIIGDSAATIVTLDSTVNVLNCSFENISIAGDMDGSIQVENCFVGDVVNVSGVFHQTAFGGTVTLNGETNMFDCYSRVQGLGYPNYIVGAHDLVVRNHRGSFGLDDAATGHLSSIGISEGQLIVESTCFGGEVHMRGIPFDLTDNSGALCTVLDETEGVKVSQIPFNNGVAIDVANGFAGTGLAPNGNQIGTRLAPSNNTSDTKTIADREGFNQIYVINHIFSFVGDFSDGYIFIGDSVSTAFVIDGTANLQNCSFETLSVNGQIDGLNTIKEARVVDCDQASGTFFDSEISTTTTLSGALTLIGCVTKDGATFSTDVHALNLTDFHGSVTVADMTAGESKAEIYGGSITVDANCTGGVLTITGSPYEIIDNSTGTTIIDLTGDTKTRATNTITESDTVVLEEVHNAHYRRRQHNFTTKEIVLYDSDNVTPIFRWDAPDDLSDITPQ